MSSPRQSSTLVLLCACLTALPAAYPLPARAEADTPAPGWLIPQQIYGSSQLLPGERWESQLTGKRRQVLQPGMSWQTSTDLHRTRFELMYPVREHGFSLSTGPVIRLGSAEVSLPWSTGRDSQSAGAGSSWSSGAPQMSVTLGPSDRVQLEAKLSRRRNGTANQRRRTTSLSWHHSFSKDWSLSAGLREIRENGDTTNSITAETYASIDAFVSNGWRWSFASSLSDQLYASAGRTVSVQRDRSASVALTTRYKLPDGWWFSGELKSTQIYRREEQRPANHAAGLKLYRDF